MSSSPDRQVRLVRPAPVAELIRSDVTVGTLRGPRWRATARGWYVRAYATQDHPDQRIVEAAAVLPRVGAVGGWAAARALGATVLEGRGIWGGREEPVLLCLGPGQIRERPGTRISRSPLPEHDVCMVAGIRVTSPLRTTFDGMRLASRLEDAVAFGDVMLHRRLVDLPELAAYVSDHAGWKGIALARRALTLLDLGSRNPWESRFRVLWVVDAGMPRPRCNAPIHDEFGDLLGIVDLLDEAAGVVGEFDGGGHRDIGTHTYDNLREETLEDHGLVVVRATSLDFGHRARTAGRIRRAYARAARGYHAQRRWTTQPERKV
ncbi:MAG: hypothetical protein ABJA86_11205 [Nocardioidaceae bacterium]